MNLRNSKNETVVHVLVKACKLLLIEINQSKEILKVTEENFTNQSKWTGPDSYMFKNFAWANDKYNLNSKILKTTYTKNGLQIRAAVGIDNTKAFRRTNIFNWK